MPDRQPSPSSRPSTLAVAVRDDGARAPRVVATGKGALAEQILATAFAHDVKVRRDADLAQLLAAVELDEEIPVAAFAAVAEMLTYVYRANGAMPPAAGPEETRP